MVAVDVDLKPLVEQARAGDSRAWDRLFQRYQLPLYTYVYEWARDEQASLDLVQETFISAFRNLDGLRDDARFGSWLFGIAHQKCAQRWRRLSRERIVAVEELPEPPAEEDDNPAAWLLRREQEEQLMSLLEQLSPAHRSVLMLHFLEDFPIEEIAAITGAPPGTVKSRLHHARRQLRALLEESQ